MCDITHFLFETRVIDAAGLCRPGINRPYKVVPIMVHASRSATFIIVACCAVLLNGCYLWKQGTRMFSYTMEASPVSKLLQRPETPDSLKRFFALVNEIRTFAFDSIGLRRTANYTTYMSINKGYLINVVSASGKADFTPYTWCYPLFGCWPLRGYFDRADADSEAARLSRKGYDVYVGRVDAFSTLGFLSDPLYSFMKNFPVYELANLIIHEQTHATVYVKNQVDFNEELACFTGSEGALRFIRAKYGDTSAAYTASVKTAQDIDTYYRLMRSLYNRLSAVYKSGISVDDKLRQKQAIIAHFKDSLAAGYDSLFLTPSFKGLEKANINNAFVSADMTYTLDLDLFYRLYKEKDRDLRAVMQSIKVLSKEKGDCRGHLRELLDSR
jgi:predicted aminopeptidase